MDIESRFWAKVDASGDCWEWTACLVVGYGQFCIGGGKRVKSHRFSYELLVGQIPEGLVIDHLCRNRKCVNPDHLEPVPMRTNTLRGVGPSARYAVSETCSRGHLWTTANTHITPGGWRRCRKCNSADQQARYRRLKRNRALGAAS